MRSLIPGFDHYPVGFRISQNSRARLHTINNI